MKIRNFVIRLQYFLMGYALACDIGKPYEYPWIIDAAVILMWINLWLRDNEKKVTQKNAH